MHNNTAQIDVWDKPLSKIQEKYGTELMTKLSEMIDDNKVLLVNVILKALLAR